MIYNGIVYQTKAKGYSMKIQVKYKPQKEEIFVWGIWGPKTIDHILSLINKDIKNVNKSLRGLYE